MSALSIVEGNVIFASKPFVYTLVDKELGFRCECCLQRNENLRVCGACKSVHYCSNNCQKTGWQDHRRECKQMKKCGLDKPKNFVLLLARTLLKLKNSSCKTIETVLNVKFCFDDLVSRENEIRKIPQCMDDFHHFLSELRRFMKVDDAQKCFETYCRICFNCQLIIDHETSTVIGVGVYLGVTAVPHACIPNTCVCFDGPKLELVANRYISEPSFQTLTLCYVGIDLPTSARKKLLKREFNIDCSCERCQDRTLDFHYLLTYSPVIRRYPRAPGFPRSSSTGPRIVEIDDDVEQKDTKVAEFTTDSNASAQNAHDSESAKETYAKAETLLTKATATACASNTKVSATKTRQGVEAKVAEGAATTSANTKLGCQGLGKKPTQPKLQPPEATADAISDTAKHKLKESATSDNVTPPLKTDEDNELNVNRSNLTWLREKQYKLHIQLLQQQLAQEAEKHAMSMKGEQQRLQLYEQQQAAYRKEETYWRKKHAAISIPPFPLGPRMPF